MLVFHERRRRRSTVAQEALTFQLDACARRSGVDYMVLADQQGFVIARSRDVGEAEEVAAYGPFLAERKPWSGRLPCESGPRDACITPFRAGSQNVYLCAVGSQSRRVSAEMLHAQCGVRRILGS